MTFFGRAAEEVAGVLGEWAVAEESYGQLTVEVPAEHWITALERARDGLGCGFFDWLSAVDELAEGFAVYVHAAALPERTAPPEQSAPPGRTGVERLLIRTRIPRDAAELPTAVGVWAGAGWHERETHEMFGIGFAGHPGLDPLLLPDGFEGHPLRKEFVLAARVAKAWPGAKEPGESEAAGGTRRRKMQPPGVPDPNEWGPLAGTLPPEPSRPGRGGAGRAAGGPRRTRTSTGATPPTEPTQTPGPAPDAPSEPAARAARSPRRNRSASEGSASQQPDEAAPPSRPARRSRSVSSGSASQRTSDAPWQNTPPEPEPGPAVPARPAPAGPAPTADVEPADGDSPPPPALAPPTSPPPAVGVRSAGAERAGTADSETTEPRNPEQPASPNQDPNAEPTEGGAPE